LDVIIVIVIVDVLFGFVADLGHGHAGLFEEPTGVGLTREDAAIDAIVDGVRDV